MKLKLAILAAGVLAAASTSAMADGIYRDGIKDPVAIPAPIPVPAPIPIQEGFTYYFRGDLGYGWAGKDAKFSETGYQYGNGPNPFTRVPPFAFGGTPFTSVNTDMSGVILGTVGMGAYITRHLRGDLTLDFRNKQDLEVVGTYSYASPNAGNTVNGVVRETLRTNTAIVMANGYVDILPRGIFTPYIGAGIGFAYNDVTRSSVKQATEIDGVGAIVAQYSIPTNGKDTSVTLAAALMGGVSFAIDHRWVLDVGYRAQYLGGDTSSTIGIANLPAPNQASKATMGDHWEHQVRIGVRINLW